MISLLLTTVYFLLCTNVLAQKDAAVSINNRPIIGILSVEGPWYLKYEYSSTIAASYVKAIESAGGRAVPIMISRDRNYYENLVKKINGVLFPGGSINFHRSNGYAAAGKHIYDIARSLNDQGDHFPIFGTCLGFQFLFVLGSDFRIRNLTECNSHENMRLIFAHDYRSSKLFKGAPDEIIYPLANDNITINSHSSCATDELVHKYNLTKDWLVTSRSCKEDGFEFIASIENKRYPFYGVQFHPEKPAFEWNPNMFFTHTAKAIKTNRYFMDFFINECRKNKHAFANVAEENQYLMYNYSPYFTGKLKVMNYFTQTYFFKTPYS